MKLNEVGSMKAIIPCSLALALLVGGGIWGYNRDVKNNNARILANEAKEVRARLVNQDIKIAEQITSRLHETAASITLQDLERASSIFNATPLKEVPEDYFGNKFKIDDHPSPFFMEERTSVSFELLDKDLKKSRPDTNKVGVFYSANATSLSKEEEAALTQKGAKPPFTAFKLRVAETVKGPYTKHTINSLEEQASNMAYSAGRPLKSWERNGLSNQYFFDLYAKDVKVVFASGKKFVLNMEEPVSVEGKTISQHPNGKSAALN